MLLKGSNGVVIYGEMYISLDQYYFLQLGVELKQCSVLKYFTNLLVNLFIVMFFVLFGGAVTLICIHRKRERIFFHIQNMYAKVDPVL